MSITINFTVTLFSDLQRERLPAVLPENAAVPRRGLRRAGVRVHPGRTGHALGRALRASGVLHHLPDPGGGPLRADPRPGETVPRHAGCPPAERIPLHRDVQPSVSD